MTIRDRWTSFFHSRCSGKSLHIAATIRILYGVLLLSNIWGLFVDFDEWFVQLLPVERAKTTIASPYVWAIWEWIPEVHQTLILRLALIFWMVHAACFAMGCYWPRVHCFAIFWWHTQFHAHNGALWNGEDVVFRMFSFFLLFFPLRHGNISSLFHRKSTSDIAIASWPMVCSLSSKYPSFLLSDIEFLFPAVAISTPPNTNVHDILVSRFAETVKSDVALG